MEKINLFIKECDYRGEHYSVKDNGEVMRHARKEGRMRPLDGRWTFGRKDINHGYMHIGQHRVHAIVATAFHGNQPADYYVVDHIDTNRCNNRPENLRWVTRLDNILENPFTLAKIENICGSVEAFLDNPDLLRGHESEDSKFEWMRTVSKEEAQNCKANLEKLFKSSSPKAPTKQPIGEWIYKNPKSSRPVKTFEEIEYEPITYFPQLDNNKYSLEDLIRPSLTPNAYQPAGWHTDIEYPLCPSQVTESALNDYLDNLEKGKVFSRSINEEGIVKDYALDKAGKILLIVTNSENEITPWRLEKVIFINGKIVHTSESYSWEQGAMKQFTLAQGKEWTGGDSIDDYCQ